MNVNAMRYLISESVLMLGRRKGSNIISIVIMGLSLLILVVFLLVTLNISRIIEATREEHRVYVYLEDGLAQNVSQAIQLRLLGSEGIEEVIFISKEEALARFREALGENRDILEALEENPLPDEYRVKLRPELIRSDFMGRMASEIEGWDGVEEVRYGRRWLERGETLVRGFYIVDLCIGAIIFLSVIFVISNTVRLMVISRRKAIDVMKLVGATNAYIQVPFIMEGALQGIFAALLAVGLLVLIYLFGTRYLSGLVFLDPGAVVGFIVFCALLGALGSFTAMRRFLKM
ncbi:MAG: ABC transporter permease [bacterium]|nr:MAG: ABC transporter permease [bacterium]